MDQGPYTGIVTAVQRGNRRRAKVSTSLHHLASGQSYPVVASSAACSKPATRASRVFSVPVRGVFSEGAGAFSVSKVPLGSGLAKAKSLRLFETGNGKPVQKTCSGSAPDRSAKARVAAWRAVGERFQSHDGHLRSPAHR